MLITPFKVNCGRSLLRNSLISVRLKRGNAADLALLVNVDQVE